jgi:hypothetical protein
MSSLEQWDRLTETGKWSPAATFPYVLCVEDEEVGKAFMIALPRRLLRKLERLSDRVQMYEEHIVSELIAGALERAEVEP